MYDGLSGYSVFEERNANTCKLYFVQRKGKKYVIKEYINYRFPVREAGVELPPALLKVEKQAEEFFGHLKKVAKCMRRKCRVSGLLNIPVDVFRRNAYIYKVTRLIDSCGIAVEALNTELDQRQMRVLLMSVLAQAEMLGNMGFVAGDIKPENLVIARNGTVYSAALIDFESGFFIGDERDSHSIEYTPEYASPELLRYEELLEEEADPVAINEAFRQIDHSTDVFSLGCVFAHFLRGEMAGVQSGEVFVSPGYLRCRMMPFRTFEMHPVWHTMITKMTLSDPARRPTAKDVLDAAERAEKNRLMSALQDPFRQLPEFELDDQCAVPCGGQMMCFAHRKGNSGQWLIWHLFGMWRADERKSRGGRLWQELHADALRRRKRLDAVTVAVNACKDRSPALNEMIAFEHNGTYFSALRWPVAANGWTVCGDELRLTPEEADSVMIVLLETVKVLHEKGLLYSAIAREDVWIGEESDGRKRPLLIGLYRLWFRDAIPEPEDVDGPAELYAPEVALYAGSADAMVIDSCRKMIGVTSDIFSLGLIYHMLLCSSLPQMTADEYVYHAFAAADGEDGMLIDDRISDKRRRILRQMLSYEPQDRPESCDKVIEQIRQKEKMSSRESEKVEKKKTGTDAQKIKNRKVSIDESGYVWKDFTLSDDAQVFDITDVGNGFEESTTEPGSDPVEETWDNDLFNITEDEEMLEGDAPTPDTSGERLGKSVFLGEKRYYVIPGSDPEWMAGSDDPPFANYAMHRMTEASVVPEDMDASHDRLLNTLHRLSLEEDVFVDVEDWVSCDAGVFSAMSESEAESETWLTGYDASERLSPEEIDALMRRICTGIERMHQEKLLCGALTGSNVLLRDGGMINASEYSLRMDDDADLRRWTKWMRRCICGAPEDQNVVRYLSPEAEQLVMNAKPWTLAAASDVYALGMLYHVLLCGCLPDIKGRMREWETDPDAKLLMLDEGISFYRRCLIRKMTERDPEARLNSCQAVLEAFEAFEASKDKPHTVTMKQMGTPLSGQTAKLFAKVGDRECFVAEAVTDEKGRAIFTAIPMSYKYVAYCGDIAVNCRWRTQ